jgi:hypothetical protein
MIFSLSLLVSIFSLITCTSPVQADVIVLKSGGKIVTSKAWEDNGEIKFYLGNQLSSYPKESVEKLENNDTHETIVLPSKSGVRTEYSFWYRLLTSNAWQRKCTVNVMISDRVDKEILQLVALKIKDSIEYECDKLFINYYLPGMSPYTSDAWAISHFTPTLKVQIMGLKDDQAKRLCNDEKSEGELGKWLDDAMGTITLRKAKSGLVFQYNYKDGGSKTIEVEEQRVGSKRILIDNDNQDGEYFIIDESGNMQLYDPQGQVVDYIKIR